MTTRARPRPRHLTSWLTFTYRMAPQLAARVDAARWRLRLPSRTALITRAVEEFLDRSDAVDSDGAGDASQADRPA